MGMPPSSGIQIGGQVGGTILSNIPYCQAAGAALQAAAAAAAAAAQAAEAKKAEDKMKAKEEKQKEAETMRTAAADVKQNAGGFGDANTVGGDETKPAPSAPSSGARPAA